MGRSSRIQGREGGAVAANYRKEHEHSQRHDNPPPQSLVAHHSQRSNLVA